MDIDTIKYKFAQTGFVHIKNSFPVDQKYLLDLASSFGKLLVTDRHTLDHPALQIVSDTGLLGKDELRWHSDWSCGRDDFFGTLLYNQCNGELAPTYFVDMQEALERLSASEQLSLRQTIGVYFPQTHILKSCFTQRQIKALKRFCVKRPFIIDHPVTDQPTLYFSPGTLQLIETSDVDIDELTAHCEKLSWVHHWSPNDILLWDNLRLMHRRPAFEGSRKMLRVQFDPKYKLLRQNKFASPRHDSDKHNESYNHLTVAV